MDAVNAATRQVFDLVWLPFAGLPAWIGLFVFGVLFGVVALVAMKYTIDPRRVTAFKDCYQGHILAIKLFRDSFTVVMSSLVKTLFWVGGYLTEQFKPVLIMLVPFVLLFAQMQMRLGFRPLDLEREVLVTVELDPARVKGVPEVALDLPDGVVQARPPVREPALHRVVFALVPKVAGHHELRFRFGAEVEVKTLDAGAIAGMPMVSPMRSAGFFDQLENPAEHGLAPSSAFTKIAFPCPVRPVPFLGLDLSFHSDFGMMLVFIVVSIVAALALKDLFGVTL